MNALAGPDRVAGMPRMRGDTVKSVMHQGNPAAPSVPSGKNNSGGEIDSHYNYGEGFAARQDPPYNQRGPNDPSYAYEEDYQKRRAQQDSSAPTALPSEQHGQYEAHKMKAGDGYRYGEKTRDYIYPPEQSRPPSSPSQNYGYYPDGEGDAGAAAVIDGGGASAAPHRPKIAANARPRAPPPGTVEAPLKSIHDRLLELQVAEDAIRSRLAVQDKRLPHQVDNRLKQPSFSSPNQKLVDGANAAPVPGEWAPAPQGTDEAAPFGTDRNAKVRVFGE